MMKFRMMTLTYDVFSDPGLGNGEFGDLVNAQNNGTDVNAEVFVNAAASPSPEPAGVGLVLIGCTLMVIRRQPR
jgi:hypothetical protein